MVRFNRRKIAVVAAVVTMSSLVVACGPSTFGYAPSSASAAAAAPVSFACEPGQRAVMRQVLVNGTTQQQLSCESTPLTSLPVSYAQARYVQTSYAHALPADSHLASTTQTTPEVAPGRVVYQRVTDRHIVTRPKRSVRTSALIIGSSAAGGAGIGALIGGTKGAGIGALAGGGAAALWDQITRHK